MAAAVAVLPYVAAALTVVGVVNSAKAQKQALNLQAQQADRQAAIDSQNASLAEANARTVAANDVPVALKNAEIARGNAGVANKNADLSVENQKTAEANAERATLQGLADSVQQQRVAYAKLSAMHAAYGASGIRSDSGSAQDVLEASAAQAELDRQNIEYSATLSHDTFVNQARSFANQGVGFRNQAAGDLNQAQTFENDAESARLRAAGLTNVATSYGNQVIGARETAALDRTAAGTATTNGYLTATATALQGGAKAYDYYTGRPGTGTPIPVYNTPTFTEAQASDGTLAG